MPYKKRLYYKQEEAKARDYSLFVIACEGTKTEPSYFAPFDEIDRIKVRLLEHSATESAPSHILERAKLYIAEEGLDAKYGDSLWCVTDVDMEERTLMVDFDGTLVEYEVSELDELTLAYATTIHKSQGSEYPIVVMPVLMNHYVMLQRNLIYTGITRAKKICVLIGSTKALAYAIHNMTVLKRNTKLKERLNPLLAVAKDSKVIPLEKPSYQIEKDSSFDMVAEDKTLYGDRNK